MFIFYQKLEKSKVLLCYNRDMDYTFSVGWMFGGLLIALVGGLIVIFYRQISENLANGVSSYEHVKLFGVVGIIIGLLIASNLMPLLLTWLVKLLFGK